MSVPLDNRLGRVEGRRTAAGAEHDLAAVRPTAQVSAAMAAVIRNALARAGVDAAGATRLCFADEAATPLAASPDAAEVPCEDAKGSPPLANVDDSRRDDSPGADDFESKILAMVRRFAGGQRPDFANSSFAELFAWSLAQPAAK
jgi:hypothetical protein